MIAKKTTLASKISVTTIILLSSLYSNASVNKLFLRLLSFLLTSFSIVLNSSVSNLCHLVSPKVVGLLNPFLQSAFASPVGDERTRSESAYLRPICHASHCSSDTFVRK